MASETLNSAFQSSSSSPVGSCQPLSLPPPHPPNHPDHPNRLQSTFCTSKSSNWLQRLRSSRGFPDSDHIDLDHFLSTSPHNINPAESSAPTRKTPQPDQNRGSDLINNLLSELFYMGDFEDESKIKRKKSCRKQQCPRICVVSTDLDVPLLRLTSSSGRRKNKEVDKEEAEEKGYLEYSGYSQTEVTVIDTSVPCWKFEKVLYRSRKVWRVGDKKGKGLMSADRKKRKEGLNENAGDVQQKKNKLKNKLRLCNSLKYVDKEESMVLSNKTDQVLMYFKSLWNYA